jgi:RimJ/RimL family protein N-acetyltransferase
MGGVAMTLLQGELVCLAAVDAEAELETIMGWWRDTEFARLLDSGAARPLSPKQAQEDFGREPDSAHHSFFIRTLEGDRLVGFVGLWMDSPANGDAWLGIGIGARADWGRGYGTEALRLMLRYGFEALNLHRVTLNVFGYNTRAIRAYEKAGFTVEGRERGYLLREARRWDVVHMGVLRSDWMKQR